MYTGPRDALGKNKGKGFWDTASYEEKLKRMTFLFNKSVIKGDGCWGWKNALISSGSGVVASGNKKATSSYRVSWMIFRGPIPEGLCVLHKCDNRVCTNPDHLYLGTAYDNVHDAIKKNRRRYALGEQRKNSILTSRDVVEIRRLISLKNTQHSIANKFNVKPGTIQNIVDGKTWKHVK